MSESATNDNSQTVKRLLLVTVAMFGFGYALVPLYDVFCEVTGLNGKTGRLSSQTAQAGDVDKSRTVTVEFVANISSDLPWRFTPVQTRMTVHPGELALANYMAENIGGQDVVGQAVPSVSPGAAGAYFNKTECFCFTEQLLKAGESKEMPVQFVVDPFLPKGVSTITLSYTFFNKTVLQHASAE